MSELIEEIRETKEGITEPESYRDIHLLVFVLQTVILFIFSLLLFNMLAEDESMDIMTDKGLVSSYIHSFRIEKEDKTFVKLPSLEEDMGNVVNTGKFLDLKNGGVWLSQDQEAGMEETGTEEAGTEQDPDLQETEADDTEQDPELQETEADATEQDPEQQETEADSINLDSETQLQETETDSTNQDPETQPQETEADGAERNRNRLRPERPLQRMNLLLSAGNRKGRKLLRKRN